MHRLFRSTVDRVASNFTIRIILEGRIPIGGKVIPNATNYPFRLSIIVNFHPSTFDHLLRNRISNIVVKLIVSYRYEKSSLSLVGKNTGEEIRMVSN